MVVEDVGNCKRFENRCKFIQAPTHVTLLIDVQHFSPGSLSLPSYLHHLPHCRVSLPQYLMKQRQPWDLRSYWLENDLGPGTSPSPLSYLTPYWDPLRKQLSVSSLRRYGNGPHPHYHDHIGDRFTTTTAHSTNHDDDGIPSVQCKLSLRFLLSLTPRPLSVPRQDRLASSPQCHPPFPLPRLPFHFSVKAINHGNTSGRWNKKKTTGIKKMVRT